MKFRTPFLVTGGLCCALALVSAHRSLASDHADTAANFNRPGADLADVFIFPSPTNDANVVLVMDVHPLIPAGQGGAFSFDPNVLYQFKIDNNPTADYIEDLVIQLRFSGSGANQQVLISGPYKPATLGTTAVFARPYPVVGKINTPFSPVTGMTVFAGARSDPFFFDLLQFFTIFPDRGTPTTGKQVDYPSVQLANTPGLNLDGTRSASGMMGFRGFPATYGAKFNTLPMQPASDFLMNFNVLSIVIEMPRTMLTSNVGGGPVIRLWETTSALNGAPSFNFTQMDRLARPAINEALATVTQNHHLMNNLATPVAVNGSTGDSAAIGVDIYNFMINTAGRSTAFATTLASVLSPDVMVADLSKTGVTAGYLGVESGGKLGTLFGGRALTDDIIDTDLMAVFGSTLVALGVPDDGNEIPQFQTDNIGKHTDYMIAPNAVAFPYLGNPR